MLGGGGNPSNSNLPYPPYAHFPPIQLQGIAGGGAAAAGGGGGADAAAAANASGVPTSQAAGSWPIDRLPGFSYPGQDSNILRSPFWSLAAQQQQLQHQPHHMQQQQQPDQQALGDSASADGGGHAAAVSAAAAAAMAAGYQYGAQAGNPYGNGDYDGLIWGAMQYANGDYENGENV